METSENNTHFKNILSLGTEKKLSWNTVDSILCDDMTLTFEETKQLVKVLLKELQTMQIKLDQKSSNEESLQSRRNEMEVESTNVNERNEHDSEMENNFPVEISSDKNKIESSNNLACTWTCNETFENAELLQKHKKIHSTAKNFPCKKCGQLFRYQTTLLVHERSHTGERPFQCNVCAKSYLHKSHLL